ncbi:MAG TPA: Gfo/Idh/MocA family oxidoreductase [Streptosporangiaceae bacterium]|nr:Gfo/Idh/MocA family oxidoreductase [Streptosporangiaceae bacterium]
MPETRMMRLGIAGARRGASLLRLLANGAAVSVTVFDPLPDARAALAEEFPGVEMEETFEGLLNAGVEAIYLASPSQYHAAQAIEALRRDIHVLSEVPPAVDVDEARVLVRTARRSAATYMLAENYCYTPPNETVLALAREGAFGRLHFGEACYVGALPLARINGGGWYADWVVGVDAVTYPTHPLGPLLEWFDERIVSVSCAGSGCHTRHTLENTLVMLGRLDGGGLVQVRFDLLSRRPTELFAYGVQGTDGSYEAGRGPWDRPRVHFPRRSPPGEWEPLDPYVERYAPAALARGAPWGSPLAPALDFLEVVRTGRAPRFDVYRALDMTLPGLVSGVSLASGGEWIEVPDPRTFTDGE